MGTSNSSSSGGIGFLGALFIVFLVLKLTNVIAWSWWWVSAPLWGGLALVLGIAALVAIGFGVAKLVKAAKLKRRLQS